MFVSKITKITKTLAVLTAVAGVLGLGLTALAPVPSAQAGSVGGYQVFAAEMDCKDANLNSSNCGIIRYLVQFIGVLSASVGVVVLIMVAWGGLEYTSSRDNPQQTAQAIARIRNALLALVAYVFVVAFLNWIIPGGVL